MVGFLEKQNLIIMEKVMFDTDERKFLSALCHGSNLLSAIVLSICVPVAVMFATDDPVVKKNAKEAINFHFNVWFCEIIIVVLMIATYGTQGIWGFFGLILLWGLTIWGLFNVLGNPNKPFRYPLIFRILKTRTGFTR